MHIEKLLRDLATHAEPPKGARERVFAMMKKEMRAEEMLRQISHDLAPAAHAKQAVWARVSSAMRAPAASVLSKLGAWLQPSNAQFASVRERVLQNLVHPEQTVLRWPAMRFAAAFAVFALLVRMSPLLFLAPQSSAESSVLLLATRGTVEQATGDAWQTVTGSVELSEAMQIRTGDGEATVVLHDDGNIRLDANAHIILRDLADRPQTPDTSGPSLTLLSGKIWVQGLVPQQVRGIVIATPQGDVTVREGSVSISVEQNGHVLVAAWDRHVIVDHDGSTAALIAGEYVRVTDAAQFSVQESGREAGRVQWVRQNLAKDAVHRREIAELQKERRAADAGILPTSPLYPVKRIAERVDLLMTFGEEEKVKKQIAFAGTRLDEAAALIAQGDEDGESAAPLEEYRTTLLQVATASGTDIASELLAQEMTESIADVAVISATEESYILKRAVLEASAALPNATLQKTDVEAVILVDTLDALQTAAQSGSLVQVQETFTELKPYLKSIKEGKSELPVATRKEALALLEEFAVTVTERDALAGDVDDTLLKDASQYLAPEPVIVKSLTDDEIAAIVDAMKARIFAYKLPRSRWNQLHTEFRSIESHPDRGRILRALYHALPEDGLAPYVRTEIQELREALGQ